MDGQVLTAKEVCALLRHPSTLYKLTKQGRIPSFRIGNDWQFRTELIERWMAEKSMYARLASSSHRFVGRLRNIRNKFAARCSGVVSIAGWGRAPHLSCAFICRPSSAISAGFIRFSASTNS